MTRYFLPLFFLPLFLMFLSAGGVSHAKTLPSGNYDCTPSVVFQFDETGESFGVAAVLSTDTIFTRLPSETGTTLVYQAGGATYRRGF